MPKFAQNAFFLLLHFICFNLHAQHKVSEFVLEGNIKDSITRENLVGVIVLANQNTGVNSDANGHFSLKLPVGMHQLKFSLLGYKTEVREIDLKSSMLIKLEMVPESKQMEEVTVTAQGNRSQVESLQTGTFQMNRKDLSKLPVIFGETDYFKAIQLMPGVQTSGEGNAAIYVRGGGYDQNLVLLDNATVYNPTHLLGFFSVFNSDIIGGVKVIKSGIPAEYGNRLSSVMEFTTRRDIPERLNIKGNVGLLSSRIGIETPLLKQKAMISISLRKTYLNSYLDFFRSTGTIRHKSILYKSGYDFYDVNLAASVQLNARNKVSAGIYKGADEFTLRSPSINLNTKMIWGNEIYSLTWNKIFSPAFYMETTCSSSGYKLDMDLKMDQYNLRLNSSIRDYQIKNKLTWLFQKQTITAGFSSIYHNISPNNSTAKSDSAQLNLGTVNKYYSIESGLFLSDEWEINKKMTVIIGLRYNNFVQYGPFTFLERNNQGTVTDTINYNPWQKIRSYQGIDFRSSLRYLIKSNLSLKLSFTSSEQFTHLVNASSITFPTDFWISSSSIVRPQRGLQWSAGIFHLLEKRNIETSIEIYGKTYKHQIEFYKGILNAVNNSAFDDNLIFGKGRSYGAEILVKKTAGKITGWIGYTYSRTEKSFDAIEGGRWFPAKYDKPHDLSCIVNYNRSKRWSFSALFVYSTGSTYTPIVGRYLIGGNVLNEYGRYNSARMPNYHRCDISATYQMKKKRKVDSRLIFSVYNVYNRKNPFFVYPEVSGDLDNYNLSVTPKEVSIFPILPSVSWEFNF